MRTIQLRRYTLVDGEYDAFLAWWQEWMPRVRPAAGFTIEFAYGLPETNEFVWAVSAEGDEEAFLAREQAYLASEPAPRRSTACRSASPSTTSASSTRSPERRSAARLSRRARRG